MNDNGNNNLKHNQIIFKTAEKIHFLDKSDTLILPGTAINS